MRRQNWRYRSLARVRDVFAAAVVALCWREWKIVVTGGAESGGAREPYGDTGVYFSMGMTTGGPGMRADINITPMIDTLLVLIIMFLVITPTQSVGLNAAVPQQSNEAAGEAPPSTVVIYAKGGGQVEVNHQPVAVTDLHDKLVAVFHGRPDAIVFVDGDKQIEFREVAQVIDVAKGAGVSYRVDAGELAVMWSGRAVVPNLDERQG